MISLFQIPAVGGLRYCARLDVSLSKWRGCVQKIEVDVSKEPDM